MKMQFYTNNQINSLQKSQTRNIENIVSDTIEQQIKQENTSHIKMGLQNRKRNCAALLFQGNPKGCSSCGGKK